MFKIMVVRTGRGMGSALVKAFIESEAGVTAFSGSRRKLSELQQALPSPQLRTVQGDAGNAAELLAAAEGVNVIICPVYTTYDERPEQVRRMVQAVKQVSAHTGAKVIVIEGVYLPEGESVMQELPLSPRVMRIRIPELYGAAASRTLVHYTLRRVVQGKPVKLPAASAAIRDYLYLDDAARYAAELAVLESAYGSQWQLRGGGPAAIRELLDIAGSAAGIVPQYETISGWKLRLIQWFEPGLEQLLARYYSKAEEQPGQLYAGRVATSYEDGIASTVRRMLAKYKG